MNFFVPHMLVEVIVIGPNAADRLAIFELYARYCWALDTGNTEEYLSLFTSDAECIEERSDGSIEVRKGTEDIRKLVLRFHEAEHFPGHQHQMSQFVFEPDTANADHWIVRSYAWATINHPPAQPHLHWCGHVRDVVGKFDGNWLIVKKEIMGWAGEVLSRFDDR